MAKYINYTNLDFQLEQNQFYAEKVSLSISASTSPVLLSDGSLLRYAPDGAVVGSLSTDFYLTGSFPNYLNISEINENPIVGSFANVTINNIYPKSISFSVEPFQPILISAEFDWYGNISIQNLTEQSQTDRKNKAIPQYIASAYKSYIDINDLDGVGNINNFSYSAKCDRPSFFHINQKNPFRVAAINKETTLSLSSNSLGDMIDIQGKSVSTNIYLKDFYGESLQSFGITGVLNRQSYEVSNGKYLMTSADIMQTISEIKTLV
jgi:hypothetical protein